MPEFLKGLFGSEEKHIVRQSLRGVYWKRRARKAEIPNVDLKFETLSDDPLAIYKPTGAKHVDAAKAMGTFSLGVTANTKAMSSTVGFKADPHMLRHACGYALANRGH